MWRAWCCSSFAAPLLSYTTIQQKGPVLAVALMTRAEKQLPLRQSWRKSIHRCLRRFCCSCLPFDEMDYLQENDMNGDHQQDTQESGEKAAIPITVEDLGTDNCSFSLLEEDHLTLRSSAAHSATSMSVSPRPLRKKQLQPLPSLRVQPQASITITTTTGRADEEEQGEMMTLEDCTYNTGASGSLLEQPVINLIPPTPAAGADGDQFFDGNLEGSMEPAPQSSKSSGGKNQTVAVSGSEEENTLAETQTSVEVRAEPGAGQNVSFAKEKDARTNKEEDKEKAQSGSFHSACQVVPLHQHPQKSESPVWFSLKQNWYFENFSFSYSRQWDKLMQSVSYLKRA